MNKTNQPICKTDLFGTKRWYLGNLLHREDGPAQEYSNGDKAWYLYGQLHRIDGPAIEYINGDKSYYFNGHLHRLDGPATEWIDSGKSWYYHGKRILCSSQKEFERLIKLKALW